MSERALTDEERQSDAIGFYEAEGPAALSATVEEAEIRRQSCLDIWILKLCLQSVRGDLEVELSILGRFVGGGRISRERPKLCLGNSVGLAKTKLCVNADFDNKQARAEGEICRRKWTGGWTCRSFRTVALSW